jgi:phage shock protein C
MNERLYRSRDDRMLAGVAGGLAERLNIDSALVRSVWAILILPSGFVALFVYIVMAIVVPDEDDLYRGAGQPAPPPAPWPAQPGSQAPPVAAPAAAQVARPPQPMPPSASVPTGATPAGAGMPFNTTVPPVAPTPTLDHQLSRDQWRAQRRTDREARRGTRRSGSASFVTGAILILLGVWFLMREYLPALEPGRFWPIALVGLGVILVVAAATRRSDGTGSSS